MTLTNQTRHIKWHETCKCICTLNKIICNNEQRWNEDKCRRECKEFIDKRVCNKWFIWNPSNCACKCDKSCDFGEYLDYSNRRCKKKLFDKLIEECSEKTEDIKLVDITVENENSYYKCSSCKEYIVFMMAILIIFIGITVYFVYYNWSFIKNNAFCIKLTTHKETKFSECNI